MLKKMRTLTQFFELLLNLFRSPSSERGARSVFLSPALPRLIYPLGTVLTNFNFLLSSQGYTCCKRESNQTAINASARSLSSPLSPLRSRPRVRRVPSNRRLQDLQASLHRSQEGRSGSGFSTSAFLLLPSLFLVLAQRVILRLTLFSHVAFASHQTIERELVSSRIDFYQTPTQVHVSVFAKGCDKETSKVVMEENEVRLGLSTLSALLSFLRQLYLQLD